MPLRRNNTKTFQRKLYAGMLEKVQILKRGPDQQQGTVTPYVVFDCRRSVTDKTGETLQGEMDSDHRCTWHIFRVELDRVGINYLSPLDRIVQLDAPEAGRYWQPEGLTTITEKLFGNEVHIDCLRIDPPSSG